MKNKQVQIPDHIHHELLNWSRWCWRGAYPHPIPPNHCGSPEWQYQRINEDGTTESVDEKPIPVNEINAKIVQDVYDRLPWIQQQVLRYEYPQKHSISKRNTNISRSDYESALSSAVRKIDAEFAT